MKITILLNLVVLLLTVALAPAATRLVPDEYATIQAAIDAAVDGDVVIIAPDTYTGDGNRDIDFHGKAITVRSENGPENCIIDCNGTRTEPHRGFYFHSGEDADSILSGLTITNGYADYGGAIYCISSSPTLTNCIFVNNTAQYWEDYVSSTGFEDPEPMVNDGNGVHIMIPPPLPEWRGQGGGIYCRTSNPTLTNCQFTDNFSYRNGGGMYNYYNSNPRLINCRFSGNFVNSGIGSGGGIDNRSSSSPTLRNCTFSANSALYGGAMRNSSSSPSLFNCIFNGNSVGWSGGCMYNYRSNPTLTNCTFSGNSAYYGGVIFNTGSDATLSNCILWGNTATQGNEIHLDFYTDIWGTEIPSTINVEYSDVEGGAAGVYVEAGCTLNWGEGNIDADPCFAEPGYWADENDPNTIVEPNDPNAIWVNGDYHLKSEGWRWDTNRKVWTWDDVTSPCIDAGNPGCALGDELLSVPDDLNNKWGENLRINMGAFGGTAEASMGLPGWALLADLTNDRTVDFNDLKVFVNYWLETGECIPSDLNRSQAVDFVDFAIFARQRRENNYILLEIYSDGWGGLLKTATMKEEGQITVVVYEEEPYSYPPAMYYVYASRDGYYTEIYNCEASGSPPNNFITVDVDLDPIVSGKFNGVIFITQSFFSDRYLPNTDVTVKEGETVVTEFQTDQQGRFAAEIEPGNYDFEFIPDWQEYHLEPVSIGGEYQDFFFPADIAVLKPNIYIYPEEAIELDVDIVFPYGGRITTSIPDYNDGWHITVEPNGTIDGQFEYLFYESLQPDYGQYAAGWVVIREQLEDFFRNNMGQAGFNQKEIDDFIEYWTPILTEYPYYAIYPQYRGELEEMIKLEFSAQPESLIRLIYSVRGLEDNNLNIQEPVIPPFTRDGFTVTEWGVILK